MIVTTTATRALAPESQSFTTREIPWMKIGRLADEAMTAKDAAVAGGLDFTVSLRSMSYKFGNTTRAAAGRKAVVRDDTGDMLGIVSSTIYQPLQYMEAFDFMDTIDSRYVAAGSIKKGRQGFMVVKAPFQLNVLGGQDPHDLYGILRTSHDCTRAIEVMLMPLRGKCMNQLTLPSFSKNVPHRWSIKHSGKMHEKLAEAKDALAKMTNYAGRFEEIVERLANVDIDETRSREILTKVLPARAKRDEVIEKIMRGWAELDTVGFQRTGWGLVNAVSEYFDWHRAGGSPESRFLGAIEGQTHKAISRTAAHLLRTAHA